MKKISPKPKNTSPLSRIMEKGHNKTGYKATSGKLLMQLSENDHKRIAQLISLWLSKSETHRP